MTDLSGIAEEAAGKAVDGIIAKADSPTKTVNILLILGASFMFALAGLWVFYVAKPQADLQIDTMRSTNKSNEINAEANKLNAETAKVNAETSRRMSETIESIKAMEARQAESLEKLTRNSERCLQDHEVIKERLPKVSGNGT